jgi:alpha-1,6-mannosyltransferase
MVSHESLTGLLTVAGLPAVATRLADRLNGRTAASYDRIVCTTGWAAAEFRRIGASNLVEVPLGVDLDVFCPEAFDAGVRARYAATDQALIVHCGRLSAEKRPERSIEALATLHREGVNAVLVVAGDGPLRSRLIARATGLPVRFTRFLAERADVAALLATADAVLAPGPIETFGLAALEALACGTPVVVDQASALPEVVGDAGCAVPGSRFADGVKEVLARPTDERRKAARARAERFGWPAAVAGFLAAHDLRPGSRSGGGSGPPPGPRPDPWPDLAMVNR